MKICSRCKKRPAVVFLATSVDGESSKSTGYCMQCARELNIKPVTDMLDQFGIDDDQIDAINTQIQQMMGFDEFEDEDDDIDDNSLFEPGGAVSMPLEFNMIASDSDKGDEIEDMPAFDISNMFDNDEGERKTSSKKERKNKKRKYLNQYCTNLTARAEHGELDRIIGRDREIERVIQILSRRTKNNPCLIGEPGVGKTAIAEGLAIRIVEGNVPGRLTDKEIHLLDLTGLVAGTQFRGQFESRIKGLIDEVKSEGNIILFIDEVHTIVGTGDSEGSMSAANIMKPPLSRGEIQVIGATTFKEYRKNIEKDSALERRFQPVVIEEPNIEDTIKILLGVKEYYESFHMVTISDQLIRKAVLLSERYITDRFLPDKAIDLLDESCACALLRNKSIAQFETLNKKMNQYQTKLQSLDENPETTNEFFEARANCETQISILNSQLESMQEELSNASVTEEDIAKVIELWTGIPASKITENENKRLASLDDSLNNKVIGQNEAVSLISAAIRRSRVQISPRRHPASFIFVGPTGVGKTELVKVLSQELFHSQETLIRLDMSEFMEKHSVSKIIGSPPGYVGYDEAGQLTEKVRRKPYSVLLFDEIEKAHPDVLNILLQILDEGRITDAQGRTVNFENTVIIMTSNAGSDKKDSLMGFARSENDVNREKAMKALSDFLRPEFLARVDEIVIFNTLTESDFQKIAALMLDEYVKTLGERGITLKYDQMTTKWLSEKSHGGKSAARDLRNLIRREVEDKLASILVERGTDVVAFSISVNDGKLNIEVL